MPVKNANFEANNGNPVSFSKINEDILKECYDIYTNKVNGLVEIAQSIGLTILAPKNKIHVLLIGNHSAGKSSYINWYVEQHVQKESMAIETQCITFVTHGKKNETLTAIATLHLYPHFEQLKNINGLMQYLTSELCDSIAKKFPLVTFIDTPGLVDGNMRYAFDINKAILWLGQISDCIFVFFDPIGQALCHRTMVVVSQIGETMSSKIHFFLSKSDEVGEDYDRERILTQITQEVCRYPSLNRTCFEIKTIYNPNRFKPTKCRNHIDQTSEIIDKTIQLTVQNTLNQLGTDIENMIDRIDDMTKKNVDSKSFNRSAFFKRICFFMAGVFYPIVLLLTIFSSSELIWNWIDKFICQEISDILKVYIMILVSIHNILPDSIRSVLAVLHIFIIFLFFYMSRSFGKMRPIFSKKEIERLKDLRTFLTESCQTKRTDLYSSYLKQSVRDHNF